MFTQTAVALRNRLYLFFFLVVTAVGQEQSQQTSVFLNMRLSKTQGSKHVEIEPEPILPRRLTGASTFLDSYFQQLRFMCLELQRGDWPGKHRLLEVPVRLAILDEWVSRLLTHGS